MQLEILLSSQLNQTQKSRYIFSHLRTLVFKRTQNPLHADDADAEMRPKQTLLLVLFHLQLLSTEDP